VPTHLHKKLKQKKWEHKDIEQTLDALKKAKYASKIEHKHIHHATIVVSLLVMGLGNLLVAIILVPLMLGLTGWFLYALIAVLGIGMGLLFEVLTRSIESLESEHHILFSLIMPFLALISVLFTSTYANDAARLFGIANVHNPYIISFLYALCFLVPYAYSKFILKRHYYSG
jgi:hypothetical protein